MLVLLKLFLLSMTLIVCNCGVVTGVFGVAAREYVAVVVGGGFISLNLIAFWNGLKQTYLIFQVVKAPYVDCLSYFCV